VGIKFDFSRAKVACPEVFTDYLSFTLRQAAGLKRKQVFRCRTILVLREIYHYIPGILSEISLGAAFSCGPVQGELSFVTKMYICNAPMLPKPDNKKTPADFKNTLQIFNA
jgi:hypothetical protein